MHRCVTPAHTMRGLLGAEGAAVAWHPLLAPTSCAPKVYLCHTNIPYDIYATHPDTPAHAATRTCGPRCDCPRHFVGKRRVEAWTRGSVGSSKTQQLAGAHAASRPPTQLQSRPYDGTRC